MTEFNDRFRYLLDDGGDPATLAALADIDPGRTQEIFMMNAQPTRHEALMVAWRLAYLPRTDLRGVLGSAGFPARKRDIDSFFKRLARKVQKGFERLGPESQQIIPELVEGFNPADVKLSYLTAGDEDRRFLEGYTRQI